METTPLPLDAELTPPLDDWRAPLELLEEDSLDDCDVALVELVELVAVEDELDVWLLVDADPGIVAALTAANTPTAAKAAAPAQKVSRLRSRSAASRASIRVDSMVASLCNEAGLEMGTALEIAERRELGAG